MPEQSFKFSKIFVLNSVKDISLLFKEGTSLKKFPIRLVYSPKEGVSHNQVAFSVPKRLFKRAVDRNLLKRRMRESYRLSHQSYPTEKKVVLMLIYASHETLSYEEIDKAVIHLLKVLQRRLS